MSERPDAAAADLLGRVAFLWAGAVLHVRASCARTIVCCISPLITALVVHWVNDCLRQARSEVLLHLPAYVPHLPCLVRAVLPHL